jgi:hypothetical protein
MTSAEVYLEAARLIESGKEPYSCVAISLAVEPYNYSLPERVAYELMFAPKKGAYAWLAEDGGYCIPKCQQRAIRYTMLALAAAVAEAGDLGDFL